MQNTLPRSFFKSFLVTVGAVIGLFIGFFVVALLFSILESADKTPTMLYTAEIQPNAKGERKVLSKSAPVILEVDVSGAIGLEELTGSKFARLLVESRENTLKGNRVKAILLHLNTPGGTVHDADAIYRHLLAYKKQYNVPVYAYVDGMCASGGVYVASAADKIYSSDVSIIGSVGVVSGPFVNAYDLIKKIGLTSLTLTEGKGKDALNPLRPWTEDEAKPLQDVMAYFYQSFVDIVVKGRPQMSKDKLINVYGAHVFPAPQAQEYGYIDVAGASREETLEALLKAIDIEDDFYQVVSLSQSPWAALFKSESPLLSGKVTHNLNLHPTELHPEFMNQLLYLYRP